MPRPLLSLEGHAGGGQGAADGEGVLGIGKVSHLLEAGPNRWPWEVLGVSEVPEISWSHIVLAWLKGSSGAGFLQVGEGSRCELGHWQEGMGCGQPRHSLYLLADLISCISQLWSSRLDSWKCRKLVARVVLHAGGSESSSAAPEESQGPGVLPSTAQRGHGAG